MTNIKTTDLQEIYMKSNDLNYYPNMVVTRPDLKNRLEKELDNYYKNKCYSDLELSTAFMLRNLDINN